MSNILKIDGKTFKHVKTRNYTPVSIFKSAELILRIGPEKTLKEEILFHRKIIKLGFPVPKILKEGKSNDNYYYIETSLGEKLLSDLFSEDLKKRDRISKEHFESFLKLTKKFAEVQLSTKEVERNEESFYYGINVNFILEELPELKDDTLYAFDKVKERTVPLPYVLTHGDLNPHNILEKGIIDFGNTFQAPAGYDLVTNIYNAYNFPKDGTYEMKRSFEFSNQQIKAYFDEMDKIYHKSGLQTVTEFIDDFIFCRVIWSVVRMQKTPKIQKWRYDKFKRILKAYLAGQSLVSEVIK